MLPPPALRTLQWRLFRGQVLKTVRGLRSPRRIVLSAIAILLAFVWTAQTVASILFREPADPVRLREWIALGLYGYAVWHLVKAAFRPTDDPLEWTSSERQWLAGSPLRQADLVRYRLSSIVTAATFKASCFCLVMLPDVRCLPLAFGAMLTGLILVDLFRLTMDLFAWSLAPKTRLGFMVVTAAAVLAVVGSATARVLQQPAASLGWIGWSKAWLFQLQSLHLDTALSGLVFPFRQISDAALSPHWGWIPLGQLTATAASCAALAVGTPHLYQYGLARRRSREAAQYDQARRDTKQAPSVVTGESRSERAGEPAGANNGWAIARRPNSSRSVRRAACVQVIQVAWLQAQGMRFFRASLIVSFLAPFVLSLLPLTKPIAGIGLGLQVGGSLAFYSYVLLPTALKFDFRRNIDRMLSYKRLPLSPWALTLGQLATPVLALTLFQTAVLTTCCLVSEASWSTLFVGMALFVPTNVALFGFENLVFVLYPYRLHQEGIEIFLRSILMFTAKGLMMVGSLIAVLLWSGMATWLAGDSGESTRSVVFVSGLTLALSGTAAIMVTLLARSYQRFDVTCDLPA